MCDLFAGHESLWLVGQVGEDTDWVVLLSQYKNLYFILFFKNALILITGICSASMYKFMFHILSSFHRFS